MKGEGDIILAHGKLWDDEPRFQGWGASEEHQPVSLRYTGYTGAHVKSYGNEPGAPEVIRPNREIPVNCLKGIKGCFSREVT